MNPFRAATVVAASALVMAGVVARAESPKPAREVMSTAYANAKKEHKNVLVFFDASW